MRFMAVLTHTDNVLTFLLSLLPSSARLATSLCVSRLCLSMIFCLSVYIGSVVRSNPPRKAVAENLGILGPNVAFLSFCQFYNVSLSAAWISAQLYE